MSIIEHGDFLDALAAMFHLFAYVLLSVTVGTLRTAKEAPFIQNYVICVPEDSVCSVAALRPCVIH